MTIRGIRQFISKIKGILMKRQIIQHGIIYKTHNILDFSGFVHKIITGRKHNSAESLFGFVRGWLKKIINGLQPDQKLYVVFDPFVYINLEENKYADIKKEEIEKRQRQQQVLIHGLEMWEISKLKKYCQFDVQDYFQEENVCFISSQIEADIMIGSLIQKINDRENTTIFSTDCDMFVVGFKCLVQNFYEIFDTEKFFELFGITTQDEVCGVPEFLGCDYNTKTGVVEFIHKKNFITDSMIYEVFRFPEKVESVFNLKFEMANYMDYAIKILGTENNIDEGLKQLEVLQEDQIFQ